jgi:O-succinylbenzoate synthase
MPLPAPVDELLRDAHVVAIPLRVPFRGVREREAAAAAWARRVGRVLALLEYDDDEAARWLACGGEAAFTGWPAPCAARSTGQRTCRVAADASPRAAASPAARRPR